jgi:hypothetical protein
MDQMTQAISHQPSAISPNRGTAKDEAQFDVPPFELMADA